MTDYALFLNGEQISKAHSTHAAAMVEVFEAGAAVRSAADFPGDWSGTVMADGYEVKPVEERDDDPMEATHDD